MSIKNRLQRMKPHLHQKQKTGTSEEKNCTPTQVDKISYLDKWAEFDTYPYFLDGDYCMVREVTYPMDYLHGHYSFNELPIVLKEWNMSNLRHPLSTKGLKLEDLTFFDTETTGLSGGTGTSIFLLGNAVIHQDKVILRQYFLPSPGFEIPFYQSFIEQTNDVKTMITYNGKSFDWPLLKSQHTLYRHDLPKLPPFNHIDLYHGARRLWKGKLTNVKLSVVEEEILGFFRTNDVPGYLAPMLYFDFIERQDPEGIIQLMKHNEWDILSLITLYIHLSGSVLGHSDKGYHDAFEIGRWFSSLKERDAAINSFIKSSQHPIEEDQQSTHFHLGMEYKQIKQHELAIPLWKEATNGANITICIDAYLELAKVYEHRMKDYTAAKFHTQKALELIKSDQDFHRYKRFDEMSVSKRLCRIDKRMKSSSR